MPYKDSNKRKEFHRNWYFKNKDKLKPFVKIRNDTYRKNTIPQICSIENCNEIGQIHHTDYTKPEIFIWLCKKHHELEHHKVVCKICGKKNVARGFCGYHYIEYRKKTEEGYYQKWLKWKNMSRERKKLSKVSKT